ncbi:hypothetical protein Clacol_000518 [Clathrus columnatus]|uniref:Protein CASP n=1 Tax=Clathrus columnatus TaxID=1419009 RepID=A0AAV4ZYY0_9AGAM|nr:hypothetical protein Clacol_000518 [Clathrus columnatus]
MDKESEVNAQKEMMTENPTERDETEQEQPRVESNGILCKNRLQVKGVGVENFVVQLKPTSPDVDPTGFEVEERMGHEKEKLTEEHSDGQSLEEIETSSQDNSTTSPPLLCTPQHGDPLSSQAFHTAEAFVMPAPNLTTQSNVVTHPLHSIPEGKLTAEKTEETGGTGISHSVIHEILEIAGRTVEDHAGIMDVNMPVFQKERDINIIIREGIFRAAQKLTTLPAGKMIHTAGEELSAAPTLHSVRGEPLNTIELAKKFATDFALVTGGLSGGNAGDQLTTRLLTEGLKVGAEVLEAETCIDKVSVIKRGLDNSVSLKPAPTVNNKDEIPCRNRKNPSELNEAMKLGYIRQTVGLLTKAEEILHTVEGATLPGNGQQDKKIQNTVPFVVEDISGIARSGIVGDILNGLDPISLADGASVTGSTHGNGLHTKETKQESQISTLEGILFNNISETVLNRTGLEYVTAMASETLSVVGAAKDGNMTAILEDEHVQKLGMKALGMAASAVLTASGAGAVMAVASVASDVITAAKEAKENEENGKHGLTGFVFESGAKIVLKAAMQGTGAGLVAPLLEPLCQKAADCGAEVLDQLADNIGLNDVLENGLDTVVGLEEATASVIQSNVQLAGENLRASTSQTAEVVAQRVEKVITNIVETDGNSEDGKVTYRETINADMTTIKPTLSTDAIRLETGQFMRQSVVLERMLLQTKSICAEIDTFDKITDIMSSYSLAGGTKTALQGAIDAIKTRLSDRFEPIYAGLELLEVLNCMGETTGNVNGLPSVAIRKVYELTKNGFEAGEGMYQTLFDSDGDGIVYYRDTVRALALLGLTGPVVRLLAYNFHVMFSYPTGNGWMPRFKLTLPINIKNMGRTIHGRNWQSLSRAKLIQIKDVQEVRELSEHEGQTILTVITSGNLWLVGPLAFQALLFLFEWGTMWPFQMPSIESDPSLKFEELGPVFTNAIIPLVVEHWELFQKHLQRVEQVARDVNRPPTPQPVMAQPNDFSSALATWKEVNLIELQRILDAQGIEVVENQKESLVGRKALADRTKGICHFKKLPDEEKINAFKSLLKAYQTEIDSLTKRCKNSENAFLNVYKVLAEVPDPYPLLEAAVDQTVKINESISLEVEVQRLRQENVELRRRTGELTAVESSNIKLQAKLDQLETKMEDLVQERVTRKENELNATYDEKLMNYEERKIDQEVVAKLAEMDFLVADLERANSRVAAVERRNEMLRAEIEAVKSGTDINDRVHSLETQLSEAEAECTRLSKALDTQQQTALQLELTFERKLNEATKKIGAFDLEVENLKKKLRQYSDYDEIKREVEIMKFVEFANGDEDDAEDPSKLDVRLPDPNADKANSQYGKSLEVLLVAKNKRILEELTKFRILHGELEASLRSTTEELSWTTAELEKQKSLNEKLETDLLQINVNNSARKSSEQSETSTAVDGLAGLNIGGKTFQQDSQVRSSPIPFTSSADTSILPIVTGQRDRFRQRNAELEEELRKQFQTISELRNEVKTLQSDNLKLYEKVRYTQSYRDESKMGSSTLNSLGGGPSTKPDELNKYRARYEESMNPFELFRGREAARAVQALNPIERGTLVLTRHILGNRRTRNAFIVYALGLHFLVFFTLYECTVSSGTTLTKQPPPGFG